MSNHNHQGDDEPTRIIPRSENQPVQEDGPTRIIGADDAAGHTQVFDDLDDIPTIDPDGEDDMDENTVIYHGSSGGGGVGDGTFGPTCGWLVVAEGCGKGTSHIIGYGVNRIGRSRENQIPLNYGDKGISRENHCAVTYEPRARMFFLQQGTGAGLAYVNDQPVLQPMQLSQGDVITLGETSLVFVPFCGESFSW